MTGYTGAMEHNAPAIRMEPLRDEIEDLKANLESVQSRAAKLTEGPAVAFYAQEQADIQKDLSAREAELAALLAK